MMEIDPHDMIRKKCMVIDWTFGSGKNKECICFRWFTIAWWWWWRWWI